MAAWSDDELERLRAMLARHTPRKEIVAAFPGRSYRSVGGAIERLQGPTGRTLAPREPAGPARICRCGSPVENDETTDYRRCHSCRGSPHARYVVVFALGGVG